MYALRVKKAFNALGLPGQLPVGQDRSQPSRSYDNRPLDMILAVTIPWCHSALILNQRNALQTSCIIVSMAGFPLECKRSRILTSRPRVLDVRSGCSLLIAITQKNVDVIDHCGRKTAILTLTGTFIAPSLLY